MNRHGPPEHRSHVKSTPLKGNTILDSDEVLIDNGEGTVVLP